MNPNTGELVSDLYAVDLEMRQQFKPVPQWLAEEAKRELAGRERTTINLNAQSNLAAWAANQRKKQRTRAKLAKQSRKRNRK